MNNRQVAHAFAHQQTRGNGSHFFIDGDTLYSYGRHFPVARHTATADGTPCVLLTTRRYSVSTSTHIGYARSACSHLNVFHVDNVKAARKAEHKENFAELRAEYDAAILAASRARSHGPHMLERAEELRAEANRYAEAFRLGVRLAAADVTQVKARAERQARKHAAELKRQAAERAEREAAERAEAAVKLDAWAAGSMARPSNHFGLPIRLRLVGDTVQTSMGAEFPADDARRLWPLVTRAKANGRDFDGFGHAFRLGVFRVDRIDADGTVHAGCHTVPFESCRELAVALGLVE